MLFRPRVLATTGYAWWIESIKQLIWMSYDDNLIHTIDSLYTSESNHVWVFYYGLEAGLLRSLSWARAS